MRDDRSLVRRLRPIWAPILLIIIAIIVITIVSNLGAGLHGGQ